MKPFKKLIPNIFILTEGETERIYLNHLKQRGSNFSLHIQVFGGSNPLKMVKRCKALFKKRGMSVRGGDYAFCVMDADYCTSDDFRTAFEYANKNDIRIIVSNPCFEVFFLMHYTDSIPDITPKEIKIEISKYIEGYRETGDYWDLLLDKQSMALKRSNGFQLVADVVSNRSLGTNIWELINLIEFLKNQK